MLRENAKNYVRTAGFQPFGLLGARIDIECQAILALPQLNIIGIPTNHALSMRERIQNAMSASDFPIPDKKITVSIQNDGRISQYESLDLAVALTILAALGKIPAEKLESACFIGSLGLNGVIYPIKGQHAVAAFLRAENFKFFAYSQDMRVSLLSSVVGGGFTNLAELVNFLRGNENIRPVKAESLYLRPERGMGVKFLALRGQPTTKRAAIIAAAGAHHVIFAGPRGAGKTSIAEALADLQPLPTEKEWEEILAIHSVAGEKLPKSRPMRAPHFSVTKMALLGGGVQLNLGECSLAHQGVLFLDELLEFPKVILEQLRTPLETHQISLSRGNAKATLPAGFQLVAATNLSPCGLLGHPKLQPKSSYAEIQRYQNRLSQALQDRIDLQIEVLPESESVVLGASEVEISIQQIQEQIQAARNRMLERQGCPNGWLNESVLKDDIGWEMAARKKLRTLSKARMLSTRAMIGIARVARTIADLENRLDISAADVMEASHYRQIFVAGLRQDL